ncbi:MAG: PHP domain-containing protein [archaeon]
MKADFHIHSWYSYDGWLSPEKRGLNVIAITDHDEIKGAKKTKEISGKELKVIVGCEISSNRGHVLGLFLEEIPKTKIWPEVSEEIRSQGGLVVIPHPFDISRNSFELRKEDIKYIDGVEIFNSRTKSEEILKKVEEFSEKYGIKRCCGSDAHFGNEIGNVRMEIKNFGKNYILVKKPAGEFIKTNWRNYPLTRIWKSLRKFL